MTKEEKVKILEQAYAAKQIKEPPMRSCWNCNPAHEHLKSQFIFCFDCGHFYYNGHDLTKMEQEEGYR